MGLYLNPSGESKEAFLAREGTPVSSPPPEFADVPADQVLVCLIDNGPFTAAGIADSDRERTRFLHGISGRPHMWFVVPKVKVNEAIGYAGVR